LAQTKAKNCVRFIRVATAMIDSLPPAPLMIYVCSAAFQSASIKCFALELHQFAESPLERQINVTPMSLMPMNEILHAG
jgi:hypothetical protein